MEAYFADYTALLKKELIPALGCTEPIALAYVSAKAREVLGCMPDHIIARCSGNVIKNVKSVRVPFAGDMQGIEASVIIGAVGGDPEKKLQVLTDMPHEAVERSMALLEAGLCTVQRLDSDAPLHIIIEMRSGDRTVEVELRDGHTNIVRITVDHETIFNHNAKALDELQKSTYYPEFTIRRILAYADEVALDDIQDVIDRQITLNSQIAEEGLTHTYGANVGQAILRAFGSDIQYEAQAYAAAGSDARMSGCTMPVVINSGSGNQGMAVSLPVIRYARHFGKTHEQLVRALLVSNLVAIYQKSELGTLSAFCGAACAATGSGAGIAYMMNGQPEIVEQTIINTLANVSGIICDGAKASCAAKIATCVNAAILGYIMAVHGDGFRSGDGLVKSNSDETFHTIMAVGRDGMHHTDEVILDLMIC